MSIFYIDSENIDNDWLDMIEDMTSEDEVNIFFTDNSKVLKYSEIKLLVECKAYIFMHEVQKGVNALDFQLSAYLGYRIALTDKTIKHIIISGDNGYLPLISFWKGVTEVLVLKSKDEYNYYLDNGRLPKKPKLSSGKLVNMMELADDERRRLQSILDKLGTYELSSVYREIIKEYGMERGLKIYNLFKSLIRG